MVVENPMYKYKCTVCSEEFLDWDDAVNCISDCNLKNLPDPLTVTNPLRFECVYCGAVHDTFDEAVVCEQKHISKSDSYYNRYEKRKLEIAASHQTQRKLL
jgi:predicted restriction endonuclease